MKASRLLDLLLLLQTHGRMTTADLARRLDVSRRTVLRDIETLAGSGVPVYTERGRHGGVALVSGARLNASHLEPTELDVLLLGGLDATATGQIGVDATVRRTHRKLEARAARARDDLPPLRDVVVIDNAGWFSASPDVDVAALAEAVRHRKRLQVAYRRSGQAEPGETTVDPYGLALKAGRWYLVADADGEPRLFALHRVASYRLLSQAARYRPGQTLESVWDSVRGALERPGDVVIRARLRSNRLDLAWRILGSRLRVGNADQVSGVMDGWAQGAPAGEWAEVEITYDDVESVRQLLQFGDHIEVLAPAGARRRVAQLARGLVAVHSD